MRLHKGSIRKRYLKVLADRQFLIRRESGQKSLPSRPFKGLIRPLKGLIRQPYKALKGLIRLLRALYGS